MSFSFNIKEQIMIGIVSLVLVTVIFGLLIVKPQYDSFSEAKALQTQEASTKQTKQAELNGLKAAKTDAASTEAKSLSLNKKMPQEADLPTILVELDELGRENNIKVLDITPTEPVAGNGYSTIAIELKVVGTYFNITDFLYNLAKMPREYTVGDVTIDIDEQGYPLLSASISANTFIYTPNAATTGTPASTTATPSSTTQPTGSQ